MKHRIDLKDWVGSVSVSGATNLKNGSSLDHWKLVANPSEDLDTRCMMRYLWSDTPFLVTGRKVIEREHSQPV